MEADCESKGESRAWITMQEVRAETFSKRGLKALGFLFKDWKVSVVERGVRASRVRTRQADVRELFLYA